MATICLKRLFLIATTPSLKQLLKTRKDGSLLQCRQCPRNIQPQHFSFPMMEDARLFVKPFTPCPSLTASLSILHGNLKSDPELFTSALPKRLLSKTEDEIAAMVALFVQEARDWLSSTKVRTLYLLFDHLQHRSTHRSKDSTRSGISQRQIRGLLPVSRSTIVWCCWRDRCLRFALFTLERAKSSRRRISAFPRFCPSKP